MRRGLDRDHFRLIRTDVEVALSQVREAVELASSLAAGQSSPTVLGGVGRVEAVQKVCAGSAAGRAEAVTESRTPGGIHD